MEAASPAGVGRRAVAKLIDVLLFTWLAGWLSGALITVDFGPDAMGSGEYSPTGLAFTEIAYFIVWGPVLFTVLQILFLWSCGATPGKLLCGLRVVSSEGRTLSLWRCITRTLAEFVSALPLGTGYLAPWGLTTHDRLSRAIVVPVGSGSGLLGRAWPRRGIGAAATAAVVLSGPGMDWLAPHVYTWEQSRFSAVDRFIGRAAQAEANGSDSLALEMFTSAIEADPRSSLAYADRGLLYAHMGDFEHAMQDCGRSLELDSTQVFAYIGRGDACRRRGMTSEAIADYSRVIAMRPDWSGIVYAHLGRGAVFFHQGRFGEAAADFRKGADAGGKEFPDNRNVTRGVGYREAVAMCSLFECESLRRMGAGDAADRELARRSHTIAQAVGSEERQGLLTKLWLGEQARSGETAGAPAAASGRTHGAVTAPASAPPRSPSRARAGAPARAGSR